MKSESPTIANVDAAPPDDNGDKNEQRMELVENEEPTGVIESQLGTDAPAIETTTTLLNNLSLTTE